MFDDLEERGRNEAFEDSVAEQEPETEPCPDGCDHGGVEVVLESEYDDVPRRAFEADGKWWVDCDTCGGEGRVSKEAA